MPDAEFFVLASDKVDDSLAEDGPFGRYALVEAKNVLTIELATLAEILGPGSSDDLAVRLEDQVRPGVSGETALLRIPGELRDALAHADDLDGTAKKWAATEELVLSGYETDDALLVLTGISQLANEAKRTDQDLWVWMSLWSRATA